MPDISTALLIIDVQRELFQKKHPVHQAEQMLTNLCALAERAHRAGAPVIYIQHENKSMPKDSLGWQLHPGLQPDAADLFFQKEQSSALKVAALKDRLAAMGIHRLVIAGMVTHGCVKAACLDGIKLGYQVILASDGHSNFNPKPDEVIAETHQALREAGVILKATGEIDFSA